MKPTCLLLAAISCLGTAPLMADERPHIVLILCDDLGYSDLGCYGGEIETPHLDRLAADGLRFTQFYNNAKCTETRAALLAGLHHQQTNNLRRLNHVTLAEVLREAGYRTLMSGKWHVGGFNQEQGTPPDRGFDRFFGFLGGAINFYTGEDYSSGRNLMRLDREIFETPEGFFATDAFTDRAIDFLRQGKQSGQPCFLYLAYNAPHFPLHAPAADIAKYRTRYREGWDHLRRERRQRMVARGVIPEQWQLSPRDPLAPSWDELTAGEQADEALLMATYAAMIDRMDRQIGRLLGELDSLGITDNTLLIFLSDNGGCPFDHNRNRLPPGPAESYRTYDTEWAQASNTPFRLYKQWVHEGGISTPMIVRWPDQIKPGRITRTPAHLIDIMPTLLEAGGATYPNSYNGREVLPMEGVSLLPLLTGTSDLKPRTLFWEYRGARAVRRGDWKLVAERGGPWELYDIAADRSELHDLADQHQPLLQELSQSYEDWASRIGARNASVAEAMQKNRQDRLLKPQENPNH